MRAVLAVPNRTVKAYKIAKDHEKLVEANKQLANALCESNSFYNAANALSAAGDSSVELNNLPAATAFYEEACQRYREGDSEKMAAKVLEKCGKWVLARTIRSEPASLYHIGLTDSALRCTASCRCAGLCRRRMWLRRRVSSSSRSSVSSMVISCCTPGTPSTTSFGTTLRAKSACGCA